MTKLSSIVCMVTCFSCMLKGVFSLNKKVMLGFATLLVVSCSFIGCSNVHFNTFKDTEIKTTKDAEESDIDNAEINTSVDGTDNTTKQESKQPEDESITIQPVQTKEMMIYSIDVDTSEIEAVTALVPVDAEITAEFVVDTVIETLQDISLNIGYEAVKTEGDTIIVDLKSDTAPVCNVGAGFESAILDAIAQSLLDNLDEYSKVIYRVEGSAYASGHIELGFDEVYLEK